MCCASRTRTRRKSPPNSSHSRMILAPLRRGFLFPLWRWATAFDEMSPGGATPAFPGRDLRRSATRAGGLRHRAPHATQKGLASRSVTVAVPIEPVVDPHLHHLDVAVVLSELSGEEWGASRNSKCPIVQPQITIFDLRRPIGRESPFDARAQQPAAVGVVVGGGER
jgi:hypothetical protein